MTTYERNKTRQFHSVRRAAMVIALLWSAWSLPARADTAQGLEAFRNGRFSEAVSAWRDAAGQGDAAAALYLGVLYDTGFGVAASPAEALAWYQRGGERGNVTAMFNAAVMHDAGRGTEADATAALPWYEQAARAGSGRADYNLGTMYAAGIGTAADRQQAIRYFRDAVAHGVSEARARLARMGAPYAGAAGPAKPDVAMVAFQQAQHALLARGADADAQAAALFRKSAEAGNPLAAYNLGYCYERGIGVAPSVDEALMWYRRSAATAQDPALRQIALGGEKSLVASISHVQR